MLMSIIQDFFDEIEELKYAYSLSQKREQELKDEIDRYKKIDRKY